MRKRISILELAALMTAFSFAISSCGGDDGGPGGQIDNVAPVVVEIDPDQGTGVPTNQSITIEFSEPMDRSSVSGNITLTNTGGIAFVWLDDETVVVGHLPWDEATQIELTIGTGVKDRAGNNLPQTWHASFWTASSVAVLLASSPAHNSSDALLNVAPLLQFSHEMNLPGLQAATTITEVGGKQVPVWEMEALENNWYRIVFAEDLTPTTTYRIAVSSDAPVAYPPPDHLSAPVDIRFTTGANVDDVPPRLESVLPAGSTISPSATSITMTFSEPIAQLNPTRISAQLFWHMAGEPIWNTDKTALTVYLTPPLSTGVRLFAVFEPGTFEDLNGNDNAVADSVSLRVTGAADHYPVHADWTYVYDSFGQDVGTGKDMWSEVLYVTYENLSGNTFDRVTRYYDSYAGTYQVDELWHMRKTSQGVYMRGFYEEDAMASAMFQPEVLYQKFPLAAGTWAGTATVNLGVISGDIVYDGRTVGQETLVDVHSDPGDPNFIWEDCWKVIVNHEMSVDDEPMNAGSDTIWYAPGLGRLMQTSGNTDYDEGVPHSSWERMYLMGINPED